MKTTDFAVLAGICLIGFCIVLLEHKKNATSQTNLPPIASAMGVTEASVDNSSDSKLSNDQDAEWLEEYESNGPQGADGSRMQTISIRHFCLVIFIFVSSSLMVTFAVKQQTKAPNQCGKEG